MKPKYAEMHNHSIWDKIMQIYESPHFFLGVVEDRKDPLKAGRVRVRCFGYHTDDRQKIPTEDLPWAWSCISGGFFSPPKDGSWVVGFFSDGANAQFPIILGKITTLPESIPDFVKGFSDTRVSNNSLGEFPNFTASLTLATDGTGIIITEEDTKANPSSGTLKEPDLIPRVARNENTANSVVSFKQGNLSEDVPIATYDSSENSTWSEPSTEYDTTYPFNMAHTSESGHTIEVDDTPDSERISITHRSGTFDEFHSTGDRVQKIVGDGFEIVYKDKNLHVFGDINITVNGDSNIYTKGNSTVQVDGNAETYVKGFANTKIEGTMTVESDGNMKFVAPRIDFNP